MITFRLKHKAETKRKNAVDTIEKINGVFRVISHKKDGCAELEKDAKPKAIARKMRLIKGVCDVGPFNPNP